MESSSIQFASAARVLGDATRRQRLVAPSFRSPPRVAADRTVRGQGTDTVTVAVRVKGRPWLAVLADLVDGVVVANELTGADAAACRTALWAAIEQSDLVVPAPTTTRSTTVASAPGWRNRHTQAA